MLSADIDAGRQLAARAQLLVRAQRVDWTELSWTRRDAERAACCSAARAASQVHLSVGSGTARSTRSIALSLRIPVGSPDASRTIVPPSGAGGVGA